MKFFIMISLTFFSIAAMADIYRWVDESGQVRYSTKPQQGASKIDIHPIKKDPPSQPSPKPVTSNTTHKPPFKPASLQPNKTQDPSIVLEKRRPETSEKTAEYQKFSITHPKEQQLFITQNKQIPIQLAIKPRLQRGHSYRLLIDRVFYPGKWSQNRFTITLPNYRTYSIKAIIVTQYGRILQQTLPIHITLKRKIKTKKSTNKRLIDPSNPYKANFNSPHQFQGNFYQPTQNPPDFQGNYDNTHEFLIGSPE